MSTWGETMRTRTMTTGIPAAKRPGRPARARRTGETPTPAERRTNLVVVSWMVTAACAYLGFTAPQPAAIETLVLLAVAAMVLGNVVLARLDPRRIVTPVASVAVAVWYTGLLLAVWHFGGQGSIELLVAAIALLDLALVGLSAGELAAVSLAMFFVYAVIV